MSLKLLPVSHAGLPDRLVLLPDGSAHLIELKAPGGHVRPVQRVMHERLGQINHPVIVLSSVAEVDQWVRDVTCPNQHRIERNPDFHCYCTDAGICHASVEPLDLSKEIFVEHSDER